MNSIKAIRVLSLLIMVAAAAVSYGTQRAIFLDWRVDPFTAGVAPIGVDLLAIVCTLAIHTPNVARKGRRAAVVVLVITAGASTAANALAGLTIGSKVVHGAMVVLYVMSEWIAAQVKQAAPAVDPRRSMAARKAATTRKANAARRTRKPRAAKTVETSAAAPVSPGMPPVQREPERVQ
jgi:hypothetical protein